MTKVLMTGASGFIGSNVLHYLLDKTDWEFTIVASFKHKGNPFNIPLSDRVHVKTLDLTAPIPDMGDFDYILHLASESHVDRSITDPVPFVENNISSTLQILEYARKHVPERFIMFSTDEVYGAHKHHDWDVLLPTNPYAASKAAQEMIAIAYYNTYKLPIIITNSNNIVGPSQDSEKFVPKIAKLIKEDKTVELHSHNSEYGSRIYNPVDNVADALIFILKEDYVWHKETPPRYSLTGGQELDNLQMAQLVADILGKELKYKTVDVTDIRPTYDAFYTESEDDNLGYSGWSPPLTLKEGLQWIKQM